MGFKSEQKNLTFSDLERSFKDEKNRSLKTLMNLQKTILWDRIESILFTDYPVGHKKEGKRAYSPLFLFKCLLLQKWFRIQSDPELKSQINDRQSFQVFLNISAQEASPDHSTFSRDIKSNWTIKNNKNYYRLKEHASVDAKYGFVLTTILSPASVHDTNILYILYAIQQTHQKRSDKGICRQRICRKTESNIPGHE